MITRMGYESESNRNILAHLDCLVHSNPSIMLAVTLFNNCKKTCHKNKIKGTNFTSNGLSH
jgi:hypothetical protein